MLNAPKASSPLRSRVALGLGLTVALAHLVTAPSGLFWLDAGDFATASYDLGVPHPTGYPLYTLLGKAICLVPIGSVAFRMGLLSALLAGLLTVLAVYLTLPLMSPSPGRWERIVVLVLATVALWSATAAGLAGRTPDVYALHGVLVAAGLALLLLGQTLPPRARFSALCLVIGLGLSNHAEMRLFALIFLGVGAAQLGRALSRRGRRRDLAVGLGTGAVALVAGLLPYLYLPLSAARDGYHLWGRPDTPARFWRHITGLDIRAGFEQQMLSTDPLRLQAALDTFAGQVWDGLGGLAVLALVGLGVLYRRRRKAALLLAALLVIDVAYAVLVNPMGLADWQNGLTTLLVLAILLAVGANWLLGWLARALRQVAGGLAARAATLFASMLLLGVAVGAFDSSRLAMTGEWGGSDLGFSGLQGAPEGALVLTGTEAMGMARLYWVGVGALRPDLQALHRTELADAQLLLKRSRQGPFPLAPEAEQARWAGAGPGALDATYHHRIEVLLRQAFSRGRAVLWGGGDAEDLQGRWSALELAFPLHRLAPDAMAAQPPPRLDALIPAYYRELGDPWTGRWLAEYLNFVGTWAVHQERARLALEAFERAHQFWPAYSRPLVNLGVLAARTGNFEGALSLVESALDRDPLNVTARLNQARYLCVLGRAEEAQEALGTAVRLDPRDPAIASVEALFRQLGGCVANAAAGGTGR